MPGTEPTFGMSYPVDLDPLADWPAIMQAMVTTVAATMKGRTSSPNLATLQDEVAARAAADQLLSARLDALTTGAWTTVPLNTNLINGVPVTTTGAGPTAPTLQYRIRPNAVELRGWTLAGAVIPANQALLSSLLPAAARPSLAIEVWPRNDLRPYAGLSRHEIGPNGQLYSVAGQDSGRYLNWDGVGWPLG